MAEKPAKGVTVEAIHHCRDGIYVERNGTWYRAVGPGETHCFSEIGNWSEETWERYRIDPPCARTAKELSDDFARRHR